MSQENPEQNIQQPDVTTEVEDTEDGAGMKVRSELKAGELPNAMGIGAPRSLTRMDGIVAAPFTTISYLR